MLINKLMSLELGESYTWEEYGLDIRDTSITWFNDLESDERYRRWPSSYMELLRPTYPGMLRNLRRNIYNYVSFINITFNLLPTLCYSKYSFSHIFYNTQKNTITFVLPTNKHWYLHLRWVKCPSKLKKIPSPLCFHSGDHRGSDISSLRPAPPPRWDAAETRDASTRRLSAGAVYCEPPVGSRCEVGIQLRSPREEFQQGSLLFFNSGNLVHRSSEATCQLVRWQSWRLRELSGFNWYWIGQNGAC